MHAIRAVNPAAQLIQTEDLGAAHSTPRLARQAAYENERRWLTMDLLTGRVGREHPLWSRFAEAGLEGELALLADDPCPPDIIGIDHYLTSERFLDERVERYPDRAPTSGGGEPYADIEAIRVLAEGVSGFERLAAETWARYRLPMAATEVHLGCTREEQLRWLAEIWESCRRLRKAGTDIRAVTAWALLGSYDWNSLMTRRVGYYEPGVFDLRATRPRRTALARLVRELADHGTATHPVLAAPGWWHRPDRFTYAPVRSSPFALPARPWRVAADGPEPRPILITGGGGRLACAAARLCVVRGLPYRMLARAELDAAELNAVLAAIEELRPWAIVNAAGFARVASAVHDTDRCWRDNVGAAHVLAHACAAARIPLLSFSSHLVFDGAKHSPYTESDAPAPLSVYGATKAEAERAIIAAYPQALVIRAGALFGPWDGSNFVARTLAALRRGREVAASEAVVTPSYLPDLANAALDLLIDGESGIWHLAHSEPVSWADLARAAARHAALDPARIRGLPGDAAIAGAARPRYSALGSDRAALMPSLDSALARCIAAQAAEAAAIEETALEDIAALAVG
jgi:dTDP-4-dehydrorhamnose reductase